MNYRSDIIAPLTLALVYVSLFCTFSTTHADSSPRPFFDPEGYAASLPNYSAKRLSEARANLELGQWALPLPGDAPPVILVPVTVEKGADQDGRRLVILGARRGEPFWEGAQSLVVAGNIFDEGREEWLYLIAQKEFSRSQVAALAPQLLKKPQQQNLGRSSHQSPGHYDNLPAADLSFHEVNMLLHIWNLWLFKQGVQLVPEEYTINDPYLRLPFEEEWEFAARGGLPALEDETFEDVLPFEREQTNRYEYDRVSSRGQLQPVGQLAANRLSLYDMLGNVSEMTNTRFRIDYLTSPTGASVSRGGNIRTQRQNLRTSIRREQPFYGENPSDQKQVIARSFPFLGFRVAIGGALLSHQSFDLMEARQDKSESIGDINLARLYARGSGPLTEQLDSLLAEYEAGFESGALSSAAFPDLSGIEMDALDELLRLYEENDTHNAQAAIVSSGHEAGKVRLLLKSIRTIVRQSERMAAADNLRLGSIIATLFAQNLATIEHIDQLDRQSARMQERRTQAKQASERFETAYRRILRRIAVIDTSLFELETQIWLEYLSSDGSNRQRAVSTIMLKHISQLRDGKENLWEGPWGSELAQAFLSVRD